MWIARIARPGAIYDASASSQTFPTGEMMDFLAEEEEITLSENEEKIFLTEEDFGHMPGFDEFKSRSQPANKANVLKNKIDTSKTHFAVRNLIFLKMRFRN